MDVLRAGAKKLRGSITSLGLAEQIQQQADQLQADGIPTALAEDVARLSTLVLVPEMMLISSRTAIDLGPVAQAYFAVTETFRINRLLRGGERIITSDHYESLALTRSLEQISAARRNIAISALMSHAAEKKPLQAWYATSRQKVNRVAAELIALTDSAELNLPKMTVAAGLLTDLAELRSQ